jgi:hypothetical protein
VIYVLDTSAFRVLRNFYPAAFPTLWARLEVLVQDGTLISVAEVLNELHTFNDSETLEAWCKKHKSIFAKPTNDELLVVQRIMAVPHFRPVVSQKALLKGTPVADPFVIAAAKVKGGMVVTQEKVKPNAAKIPNICEHFGVPYMDMEAFMKQQGWTF